MSNYRRRTVIGTVACAALVLAGCSRSQDESYKDDRFAPFSEYVPQKLEVKTDLESVTNRMLGLRPSAAHWVGQYQQDQREPLPYPDRPYWFHAVISIEHDSARVLEEASAGPADILPAVYPDLHQYVPEGCAFSTVPAKTADKLLDVEHAQLDSKSKWFAVEELVISSGCDLIIMRGMVYRA